MTQPLPVDPPPAARVASWWVVVLPAAALFVFVAIVLEVVGGANANSAVPDWAELVPISWPAWVRVLWWTAVGGAAGCFRVGLRRIGMRTNRVGDAVAVVPFIAFAAGIAAGADWATWH